MKSSNRRSQSLLLSAVAIATLPIQECSAGSGYDAERFSSSIVTHHDEDLALRSPLSQQQQQSPRQHVDVYRKLRIRRSMIDRDPIYFDDEGQGQTITSDGSLDFDVDEDPLSIVHQHQHKQHQILNNWQSPLESYAPLPSLSLEPNPSTTGTATISTTTSPITISPGYHHSHEIDFTKQYQQQQEQRPLKLKTRKTGTTITALLAQNSTVLILAADTRATDGSTVADKRCEKLHVLASNVWCAGAGTSADVEALVRRVKFTFWKRGVLQREGYGSGIGNLATKNININLDTNNNCDASTATAGTTLLENKEDRDVPSASIPAILHYIRTQLQKTRGNLGVNLLAGGYDYNSHRAHLAAIHPHGSMDIVTYAALGSGGLAATGVLESRYPKLGNNGCTVEEGIRLAVDAVRAGIDNDLGSGSQVDVCVIGQEGVLYRRAVIGEEELEWVNNVDGDGATSSREVIGNGEEEQQLGSSIGVNGFGNVPFAIQSKKLVSEKQIEVERERMKWLDRVVSGEE